MINTILSNRQDVIVLLGHGFEDIITLTLQSANVHYFDETTFTNGGRHVEFLLIFHSRLQNNQWNAKSTQCNYLQFRQNVPEKIVTYLTSFILMSNQL